MESWRIGWRMVVKHFSTEALEALRKALEEDDPRLIQGSTTSPPPMNCIQDLPVEGACLFGYCSTIQNGGFGVATVGEVADDFAKTCMELDQEMGEPAGCRWVLGWFDDTPREEVRKLLLPEVKKALANRRIDYLSNGAIDVDVYPIRGIDPVVGVDV